MGDFCSSMGAAKPAARAMRMKSLMYSAPLTHSPHSTCVTSSTWGSGSNVLLGRWRMHAPCDKLHGDAIRANFLMGHSILEEQTLRQYYIMHHALLLMAQHSNYREELSPEHTSSLRASSGTRRSQYTSEKYISPPGASALYAPRSTAPLSGLRLTTQLLMMRS